LDIKGIDTDITTEEILDVIRECREAVIILKININKLKYFAKAA
jgi:hypothetical protein